MSFILKKPKYIRKYDFKRSLIRPRDQWFWPIEEIEKKIKEEILSEYKKKHPNHDYDVGIDENDEDEFSFEHEKDFDLEQFEENELKAESAKIKEGKIIDQLAKEYIINSYPGSKVVDLSNVENEQCAINTCNLLKNKNNVLIFQACFIAENKAIAKPDAILKQDDHLYLIEVKSSTKYKKNRNGSYGIKKFTNKANMKQVLDLVYQKYIVETSLNEKGIVFNNFSYSLCLINNKVKAKKYTTHFDLLPCDDEISNAIEKLKENNIEFWDRIDELFKFQIPSNPKFNLAPNEENRTAFGDNECWPFFKEYYYVSWKYPFFGISCSTVISPRSLWELYETGQKVDPTNLKEMINFAHKRNCLINGEKKAGIRYWQAINNSNKNNSYYFGPNSETQCKLNKNLKKKKVYFDFETLNSALAAFDDCYPYRQVVVQASIIKDHGDGNLICQNLICDPKNITISWFRKIVDALLEGIDNVNEYSFIVYNKAFEHMCLNDIAHYINEEDYQKRIESFNGKEKDNHLFDLADYFDNRKNESCYIWPIKGFYSIKKVLDFIMLDANSKAFKLAGCENYKSLTIKNGAEAQDQINNRFFGMINDKNWKEKEKYLKQYCENDVRAMIALEYWLKEHFNK